MRHTILVIAWHRTRFLITRIFKGCISFRARLHGCVDSSHPLHQSKSTCFSSNAQPSSFWWLKRRLQEDRMKDGEKKKANTGETSNIICMKWTFAIRNRTLWILFRFFFVFFCRRFFSFSDLIFLLWASVKFHLHLEKPLRKTVSPVFDESGEHCETLSTATHHFTSLAFRMLCMCMCVCVSNGAAQRMNMNILLDRMSTIWKTRIRWRAEKKRKHQFFAFQLITATHQCLFERRIHENAEPKHEWKWIKWRIYLSGDPNGVPMP